ncbi:hypothetical protein BX616_006756 [Lobosporangium transversale]|uniref:USP domain-containing protein n=1 Tax=Lobosporangium transversale TaxID=64571 RepID=A0A1Y2GWG3_9FUNG|nr:hypothetical protein BCR41DRAFT_235652 [Lobosporangium transversale]KAF9918673.1 hypothetical protein BX616_006756 [Lobosporangium transversale]ORZ24885.1 hypothetical protein BCR41DRAFT_235652 [Lobosporangium transversale]|eukprot:XP_021883866.1 hypothetical protein BCR41DRAFT_235652 [Lobosporangium transversale]
MDVYTTRRVAVSVAVIATAVLVVRTLASSATENSGTGRASKRKSNKARATRTKNVAEFSPQYVTGLVNVGNTCFMNAVVQALASLPSLRTYLEARKDMGHAEDSITLALWETVDLLNTMHRHPTVKRLIRMVNTVKSKAAHVLTSQQQVLLLYTIKYFDSFQCILKLDQSLVGN